MAKASLVRMFSIRTCLTVVLVEDFLRVQRLDFFSGPLQVRVTVRQLVLVNRFLADPLPFHALQPEPLLAVNRIDVERQIVGDPEAGIGVIRTWPRIRALGNVTWLPEKVRMLTQALAVVR